MCEIPPNSPKIRTYIQFKVIQGYRSWCVNRKRMPLPSPNMDVSFFQFRDIDAYSVYVWRKLRNPNFNHFWLIHPWQVQGWNCRGVEPPSSCLQNTAHFWVKISHKLQCLGEISNILAADPPVLLGQFQHWLCQYSQYIVYLVMWRTDRLTGPVTGDIARWA